MEPDGSGMHTSDTVDLDFILSGEVWVELDDGREVHLTAGDLLVQHGTRHAWRNKGEEPCVFAFFVVGATRRG
jgi:quercetin dioxygenase-like cupin family protein